jgi:hypothetical protein
MDVIDGYFTMLLDFGSDVFNGNDRWLEIGVRPGELNDPNVYTLLSPRQEVTPTPHAIYAQSSGGLQTSGDLVLKSDSGNVDVGGPNDPTILHIFGNRRMYSTSGGGGGLGILGVYPVDFEGASYGEPSEIEWDFGDGEKNKISVYYTSKYSNSSIAVVPNSGRFIVGALDKKTDLSVHGAVFVHPAPVGGGGVGILGVYPVDFNGASMWSGSSVGGIATGESQDMSFISGTHKVGIGKTDPQAALDVNGVIISSEKVLASAFASNSPLIFEAPSGTERMRIDDITGNVGIGTTSPGYKLHINGTTYLGGVAYIGTGQRIQSQSAGGARILGEQGNTAAKPAIGFYSTNGIDDGAGGNGIFRPLANTMAFATQSSERMRIEAGGNVGIGTAAPGAKLEVNGQVKITGGSPGDGKVLTSDASGLATWQTPAGGTDDDWAWSSGSGLTGDIYHTAKVGIGTTTPDKLLTVDAADGVAHNDYVARFQNRNSGSGQNYGVYIKAGSSSGSDQPLHIDNTSGKTVLSVDGQGNVGIGTLTIDPTVTGLGILTGHYGMYNHATIGDGTQIITYYGSYIAAPTISAGGYIGSKYAFVTEADAGDVGIGTTSPVRKLHVNDVMRLEPRGDFPADPADGDLCVKGNPNDRHIYCYLNGNWRQLD